MSIVPSLADISSATLLYGLIAATVSGAVTVLVLLIRNWPKLVSSTVAVLHRDKERRADARAVYALQISGHDESGGDPSQIGGPPLSSDPPPLRRRRRRRRRR